MMAQGTWIRSPQAPRPSQSTRSRHCLSGSALVPHSTAGRCMRACMRSCGGGRRSTLGGCWQMRSAKETPVRGGEKESMPCMCHHASLRARAASTTVPPLWPWLCACIILTGMRISPTKSRRVYPVFSRTAECRWTTRVLRTWTEETERENTTAAVLVGISAKSTVQHTRTLGPRSGRADGELSMARWKPGARSPMD